MRRFMSFLAGTICGALVGAVTALLLAPVSGKEFQTRFDESLSSITAEVKAAYEARMKQLESELETLREAPEPTEK